MPVPTTRRDILAIGRVTKPLSIQARGYLAGVWSESGKGKETAGIDVA